jgi:hypothetical protein
MKTKLFVRAWLVLGLVLAVLALSPSTGAQASALIVTHCGDTGPGSLRQMVEDAASGDTIHFALDCPAAAPLTLISSIYISKDLTISAQGRAVVISGGGSSRLFEMAPGKSIRLESLTLQDASGGSGTNGGAILDYGSHLVLSHVTLRNNHVQGSGDGGAFSHQGGVSGSLLIEDCLFENNSSEDLGGAAHFIHNTTIRNSTFRDNSAFRGAAIASYNEASIEIERSAFYNNVIVLKGETPGNGGAVYLGGGSLNISNSTFSGNGSSVNSSGGGALYVYGAANVILTHVTIVGNTASVSSPGGGIAITSASTLSYFNSILANNSPEDCRLVDSAIAQNFNNLVESGSGCGTPALTADPNLGPLAENGGPTRTHALLAGSPAIDAGFGDACLTSDQRGIHRPLDGDGNGSRLCDLGAYEFPGATFADVPVTYWAWNWIERLYTQGVTGGCGTAPLRYCPGNPVTRAQMAIFLLKAKHGSTYAPPAASGTMFSDISFSYWAAAWVEQLANEGITSGCGGGKYCPENPVTRAQMAIFLLKSKYGLAYTPPAASGTMFADIPDTYWAAAWVEQLAREGITSGCGGGNYCPDAPVNRAQMAIFLVTTFDLP